MDIKHTIRSHGQTISSVAHALGVTQSALSQQINNGSITFTKVERIAEICGCTMAEFVQESSACFCPHCGKPISVHVTLN